MDRRWLVLSAVSIGTFMATLDGSIVNIALPSIGRAFGVNLATVEWVVVAYLLVIGSLLLPFGRLGEVVSFRRVYLAGFAIFTGASILISRRPRRRWGERRRGRGERRYSVADPLPPAAAATSSRIRSAV